jgi:hypothetical protein
MDATASVNEILCTSQKKWELETLAMIFHGRKHEPYMESPNSARQLNSKVKSMIIILFDIKGTFHNVFVLAGQTVSSAYYCDVLL